MIGIHESKDAIEAVKSAKSVFVGGGNTFLLLKTLYDQKLVELIRWRVMNEGLIYMGTSAGKNFHLVDKFKRIVPVLEKNFFNRN